MLRTSLRQQDLSLVALKHSDYGSGAIILPANMFLFGTLEDVKMGDAKEEGASRHNYCCEVLGTSHQGLH